MTAQELARIQSSLSLSDDDLLTLLNGALERKYNRDRLSQWKRETRPIPKNVAAFLETVTLERGLGVDQEQPAVDDVVEQLLREEAGDAAPGQGGAADKAPAVKLLPGGRGVYTKVCTELWQIVGTGVTTSGALAGSPVIQLDGQIIYADAETLGEAWGKLAEQNEVFARWLMQAATGGAWLQVVLATGGTAMKLMQNHAVYRQQQREREEAGGVPVDQAA